MFGLYTKHDVERLVKGLREEYAAALEEQQRATEAIKAENRALAARVLELERERSAVGEALIAAAGEGERMREESARVAENGTRELALLTQRCHALLGELTRKYPDAEDVARFRAFLETLHSAAEEESEEGIDMDEVLSPKQPLDLGKLCKGLGLMEENE